jgi:GvpD gas vesicle protein
VSEVAPPVLGTWSLPRVTPPAQLPELCLPSELRTFVSRPGPLTLLVRGPPGSGKTTLGLALLGAFRGSRILITNRVDQAELRGDFPWLELEGANSIQVIEAQDSTHGLVEAAAAVNSLSSILSPEGNEDLGKFMWLPQPVQVAYACIDPSRPTLVVIDSWDALVEEFMGRTPSRDHPAPSREEVERLLLTYMQRSGVTLVLILEREDQSQLDYLVNAVVVTERKTIEGRLERWLYVPKLRGQRIDTPSYPFTLEDARFRAIPPFTFRRASSGSLSPRAIVCEPSPKEFDDRIWPGCTDFAAAFGMLEIGTTTVIETDSEVPDTFTHLLLDPVIVQTLRAGGRVLLFPSPGARLVDFYDPLRAMFSHDALANQLRIASIAGNAGVPAEAQRVMLALPQSPANGVDPIFSAALEFMRGEGGRRGVPNLIIRTTGGERAVAQAHGLGVTPENFAGVAAAYVTSLPTHQIVIGNSGDPLLASLKDLGTVHLQLRARLGRYFLNGLRPFTPRYVIAESEGVGPYRLIRMV